MEYDNRQRIRGVQPIIQDRARVLRKAMTPAEKVLWKALRRDQLKGLYVRRQHALGQFILDFYISSCRLVIELDGSIHEKQKEMDEARSEHLRAFGCHVLRFKNEEIFADLGKVLDCIAETACQLEHSQDEVKNDVIQ